MYRDDDTRFIGGAIENSMTAFLTVQLETQLLCHVNQLFGFDLRKEGTHAVTRIGLIMTSSEGIGSECVFRLST